MNELYLPFDTDLITATIAYDEYETNTLTYYISLEDEVVKWCDQSLTKPVSLVIDLSETMPGYCVVFACINDLLYFKLRWI
jgi:hypothetical protein